MLPDIKQTSTSQHRDRTENQLLQKAVALKVNNKLRNFTPKCFFLLFFKIKSNTQLNI